MINRLKRVRRVATRYEKLTSSYLAMVPLALILEWLELCQPALAAKCPGHHQRELVSPERVAVRPGPLGHDHVRTCVAQRACPPGRVLVEERLPRAEPRYRNERDPREHAHDGARRDESRKHPTIKSEPWTKGNAREPA